MRDDLAYPPTQRRPDEGQTLNFDIEQQPNSRAAAINLTAD